MTKNAGRYDPGWLVAFVSKENILKNIAFKM